MTFKWLLAVAEASLPSPAVAFLSAFLAIGLALVHIYAGKLRFLERTPLSIWLSFASGLSVAYVFVHILPDLSEAQETISQQVGEGLAF